MPALATLSPTHPGAKDSCIYANLWAEGPHAQGPEGKQISAKAAEAYRHWGEHMPRQAADIFSYESVPANQMFYVMTRYAYLGKGLPEPFDLDDA